MTRTIALVDDDQNILTSVGMALEEEGFRVRSYTDGDAALAGLRAEPPDLILLDIKMPGTDGMDVLRDLRRTSAVPVVFLTSKDDEVDEVVGLRLGADDYVRKPFRQRLLMERIRAVLRRYDGATEAPVGETEAAEDDARIVCGELTLDPGRHACWWRGTAVQLTVTEFQFLKTLVERPGHVKTREQLMDAAYGPSVYVDDRTVDSHIKRLRKKFRAVDASFDRIETMYGMGYRFKDE